MLVGLDNDIVIEICVGVEGCGHWHIRYDD